jgi:hypothetical protein
MAGLSNPSRGPGWVIPATAATALHLLLFGCVYLTPPSPTSRDTDAPPVTMEVDLAAIEQESKPTVPPSQPDLQPENRAPSVPAKSRVRVTRTAAAQPKPAAAHANVHPQATPAEAALAEAVPVDGETENPSDGAISDEGHSSRPAALASGSPGKTGATPVLSTKPRLLSAGSTCHGVISEAVFGAPAKVTLVLQVDKDGSASTTAVRADSPATLPGLTKAAHECARRLRFAPARAANGERVAAPSMVRLTISKHYSAHAPHARGKRDGHI